MTRINNTPPYAEEKMIYQEQEILNEQKLIPQGFIELTTYGKSQSTKELELPKALCWRYNFAYEDGKEWLTLDIPQELMEKLNLKPGEKCSNLAFISPEALKREPECGGINLQSENEIFFVPQGSKLIREKEIQTELNGEEIEGLTKKLEELEIELAEAEKLKSIWRNKYLAEKENNNQEVQAQITKLTTERDNIQQQLNNQQTEIIRLNTTLQTTQQERDNIQGELDNLRNEYRRIRWKFLSSWFRKNEKSKKIVDLKAKIVRLGAELFNKDRQITDLQNTITTRNQTITNLNNQVNQLTTQINDLNQQLNVANTLIANTQNLLGINDLNNLPLLPQGETLITLLARPTQADLQTERNEFQQKLRVQDQVIDNLNNDKTNLNSQLAEIQQNYSILLGQLNKYHNAGIVPINIYSGSEEEKNEIKQMIKNVSNPKYLFINEIRKDVTLEFSDCFDIQMVFCRASFLLNRNNWKMVIDNYESYYLDEHGSRIRTNSDIESLLQWGKQRNMKTLTIRKPMSSGEEIIPSWRSGNENNIYKREKRPTQVNNAFIPYPSYSHFFDNTDYRTRNPQMLVISNDTVNDGWVFSRHSHNFVLQEY